MWEKDPCIIAYFVQKLILFFLYSLPEEISRQLVDSNTKILFGTANSYAILKEATVLAKKQIPIVCVKTSNDDSLPDGAIDFGELANPTGTEPHHHSTVM